MDPQNSLAFQRVRPHCVELSRYAFLPKTQFDPSSRGLLASLKNVNEELEKLEESGIQLSPKFADYVFVPLASLLRQDSLGGAQTEVVLLILAHLISLCWSSIGTFPRTLASQLFPLVTFLVSNDKENLDLKKKSPDFKLAACEVFKKFYISLAVQKTSGAYEFFSYAENLPSLGHSVSILLDILHDNSQEPEVQLAALDALAILYERNINDGEMLSFILPGNVSTFSKLLAKSGVTINYKVICSTLNLFKSVLLLVYDDADLKITERRIGDLSEIVDNGMLADTTRIIIDENKFKGRKNHRDNKWLRATSAQVKLALEACIPRLLKRENRIISEATGSFISAVLTSCSKSLSNCVELLTKALLEINGSASKLTRIPNLSTSIKKVLESRTAKFENIIQMDDEKSLRALEYAVRSLALQGNLEMTFLKDATRMLLQGLGNVIEQNQLKFKGTKLVEQSSMVIISQDIMAAADNNYALFPKISTEMEIALCRFVETVGTLCDQQMVNSLVEWILMFASDDLSVTRSLSIWMSSGIMAGYQQRASQKTDTFHDLLEFDDSEDQSVIAEDVPDVCYTILEYAYDGLDQLSQNGLELTKTVGMHSSIALWSVNRMVNVMGQTFKDELIDYLFPLVDCLASPSPMIRSFSQSAILSIANMIYAGSVRELLLDSIDYLVDSVSIRLNNCMTERVTTVLMVICQIGGYGIIRKFQDVLETIFRLLDYYHGYESLCQEFFQLFEIIVSQMQKMYLEDAYSRPRLSDSHIVRGTFHPWGITSLSQLFVILDKPKDTELAPEVSDEEYDRETTSFRDYFDQKLREVDSDDEESDDEDKDDDGYSDINESVGDVADGNTGSEADSPDRWVSPFPKDSYKTLIQIVSYGDRLLTHPSRPLKVQILLLMKKIIPLLSTQYNSMLPQIAKCWDTIAECTFGTDYAIIKVACDCLREIIRCSGDFVSKRFMDLWDSSKERSALLKQVLSVLSRRISGTSSQDLSTPRKFPPSVNEALVAFSEMLLEAINQTELFISEATLQEMISCCLLVIPKERIALVSLHLGDIVYSLTN